MKINHNWSYKKLTTVTIATYIFFLQTIYHICHIIGSPFEISNNIMNV